MSKVVVMDHPLIQHKIGIMRRTDTGSKDFRTLVSEVAMLECYEATRDLKLSWNGRRNACNDPSRKGRTYRIVP